MEASKSLAPINGLLILQRANENLEMKCPPIKFRMRILGPNEK
jgi:hypothetical protein